MVDAMARFPGLEVPHEAGFNIANGTVDLTYVEFGKDAGRAERFVDAMSLFHQRPGLDMKFLLHGYAWATEEEGADRGAVKDATNGAVATASDSARDHPTTLFVDVGVSHGPVSIALAEKFPSFHCIVQDLPEVVEKAIGPPELASRVKFMANDFFDPQPVCGADICYFR